MAEVVVCMRAARFLHRQCWYELTVKQDSSAGAAWQTGRIWSKDDGHGVKKVARVFRLREISSMEPARRQDAQGPQRCPAHGADLAHRAQI